MKLTSFLKETLIDAVRAGTSKEGIKGVYQVSLYRNAFYLMLNTGISAVLGFVFWVVIARLYSTSDVGLGSALISVTGLLSSVGTLGLGFGIIRFLSASDNKVGLLNHSFTISLLASMGVAIIFLAGLSFWSPKLLFVREDTIFVSVFVVFIVTAALSQILTQAFVAFRRADFTLSYSVIASLLKLALAVGFASIFKAFGIFASWGVAVTVPLVVYLLVFVPHLLPHYRPIPSLTRQVGNEIMHFSFANYVSQILWNLPTWILPLMVLNTLSAQANAYFYISWSMAGLLFAISSGTSMSLFAEGSYREEKIGGDLRRSFKLLVLLLLPSIAIMVLLGDKLLLLFGSEYSVEGASLLWLLVPATLPASVNFLYLGVARVEKKLKSIILVTGAITVGTLVLSYLLLPRLGILGAGVGWLVVQAAVTLVLAPQLIKRLK